MRFVPSPKGIALAFTLLCLAGAARSSRAVEPVQVRLDNGISATVYPPEYILEHMTTQSGSSLLFVVDNVRYHFITNPNDPRIGNRGDGSFHPMSVPAVLDALREIRIDDAALDARIFVLPYPRREVMDSSARDQVIFLSPGMRSVSTAAVHFTVVHEIGHLYQYRWLPDSDVTAWKQYAELRGIADASVYHDAATHANRPHEIFAEDFRFLFGGQQSNYSGGIENVALTLPSQVTGLAAFLTELAAPVQASSVRMTPVPNPFNPRTNIQIEFAADSQPSSILVRIFDASGRLVRRLYSGPAAEPRLNLPWDGRNENGAAASGGVYYARTDFPGGHCATKLMLVK
jgi:hypothetical protein